MTLAEFEAYARALLERVPAMTLATSSAGVPWATDVYFAAAGYELLFFSSPASRHCRNLDANPACAATVHPESTTWQEIRGLQMEGTAAPLGAAEQAGAISSYVAKFPFAEAVLTDRRSVALWAFRPARIRYLDNALGFGVRYGVRIVSGTPIGPPEREDT